MARSGIAHSIPRSKSGQRTFTILLILGFFGFVLIQKAVVAWQIHFAASTDPGSGLDTTAYVELAERVQAGDWGLGPGLYYVSPFYIYFLALLHGITKSYTAVRFIQAALGTIAIWFMFDTARRWFNTRAAWAAAILAASTGLFSFYESLILQTGVDVFLTSAALYLLTRGLTRDAATDREPSDHWDWRFILAAGIVFGIQTMNRPNVAIAAVLIVALLAALRRWRFALVLGAGLLAGMSPAAIRNAVVAHEFSLLSSHGGLNFYIGNGDGSDGFYRYLPGITPSIKGQANDARREAGKALGRTVTDAEASDYYMQLTWSHMAAHPISAALLMIRKFGWTFHAQHVALPYSYPFYQYDFPTILRFLVIGPWLLVPLGIAGLLCARRFTTTYFVFVFFVPAYAAAVALFFMSERYRLPLLVPLTIGAGAAVDLFIRLAQSRSWRAMAAPAGIVAVLLVLVNTGAVARDARWEEGLRMAAQLSLMQRYAESDAWVERLEATATRPGYASAEIGKQLIIKNDPARALVHLERAFAAPATPETAAGRADTEYALGQALLGLGREAEAIPHLEAGMKNGATVPLAGYHLAVALTDVGRTADAAAVIPKVRITDDTSVSDLLAIGRLAMQLRVPDAAAPYFQRAIEIAPQHADARLQFGVCLVVLNRYAEALDVLTDAVRLNPTSAPALAYLAYSEHQQGRLADARAHLAQALAADPNDPMAKLLAATLR